MIESRELTWQPEKGGKKILDRITLRLEERHIYGIIGPNGSGKSSFLRHVMKFLEVQQGSLTLDGQNLKSIRRKEMAKKTAFVPQETRLDTDFSVYDIVMTGRNPYQSRFSGISEEDKKAVEEALNFTGCSHLRDQGFAHLSGGEAQRAVIARAVAQAAPWLILDEPVSSLDIRNQVELMERLRKLNEEKGTSILMVLHDINLAFSYCTDIIMLREGKILNMGLSGQVITCENLEKLYGIPFCSAEAWGRTVFFPQIAGEQQEKQKNYGCSDSRIR